MAKRIREGRIFIDQHITSGDYAGMYRYDLIQLTGHGWIAKTHFIMEDEVERMGDASALRSAKINLIQQIALEVSALDDVQSLPETMLGRDGEFPMELLEKAMAEEPPIHFAEAMKELEV